ncbi:MAG TPA: PH domain-containing protein [Methylomirabilota bacterium]|nr:PH domain-containing protein [Methylomirabilota bacterium]
MGYVERHLLPHEQVIYKTKLHWILFAKPALVTLLGLALGVTLGVLMRTEWLGYASLLVIAGGLVWNAIHAVELLTSEFAVTTTRLIFKVGLIGRYTTELLLGKVESIGVQQTLIGRLLNYGDLVVTGTGGAREVFRRVHDPIGFRNHVQQASLRAFEPERGQA